MEDEDAALLDSNFVPSMQANSGSLTDFVIDKTQAEDPDGDRNQSVRADSSSFKFLDSVFGFLDTPR